MSCTPTSTVLVTKLAAIVRIFEQQGFKYLEVESLQKCRFATGLKGWLRHADGGVEMKQAPSSPIPKSTEASSNLLVKIPSPEPSKENSGIMWSPSPDRLEEDPSSRSSSVPAALELPGLSREAE